SWVAAVCATGIILGAAYMLYLYRRVVFGDQKHADAAAMPDLDAREWVMMASIAAVVLWMGVYPESFLKPMRQDIAALDARLARARPVSDAHLTAGKPQAATEHETSAHEGAH
ncbi:MAG: NADH-quinone oxidoreductase subunit M, partial [Sphingomonadales bacterium]|nr:NADH-quinone oxidoreductase subunit M [Sphingomonadales bacterium]